MVVEVLLAPPSPKLTTARVRLGESAETADLVWLPGQARSVCIAREEPSLALAGAQDPTLAPAALKRSSERRYLLTLPTAAAEPQVELREHDIRIKLRGAEALSGWATVRFDDDSEREAPFDADGRLELAARSEPRSVEVVGLAGKATISRPVRLRPSSSGTLLARCAVRIEPEEAWPASIGADRIARVLTANGSSALVTLVRLELEGAADAEELQVRCVLEDGSERWARALDLIPFEIEVGPE